jgi:FtsH-binding integral membrane protein
MVELKQNAYAQSQSTAIDAGLREYMMKVYNYMTSGLAISGLVAWGFSKSPALMGAIYGTGLQWVVMLAPLGFIFFLGARLQKMSLSAAQMTFWAFAAVMGMSMSYIFIVYTGVSIVRVFLITCSTFAAMSIYGYTTKRDLTKVWLFFNHGLNWYHSCKYREHLYAKFSNAIYYLLRWRSGLCWFNCLRYTKD